ncbi:MAG: FliM/FliN family flagellar motor C-terminal domain-containing protein [Sulfitobacter sp.]
MSDGDTPRKRAPWMGSVQLMAAPDTSPVADAAPKGTIISRKAQVGRAEHQAREMSLSKSLRLTLAKVADELLDMSIGVIGVHRQDKPGDDIEEVFADPGLLMLLDGPNRTRGAAILDGAFVGALIQQQTMGKVVATAEAAERRLTPTDAAVCAPFLDTVLKRAARLPESVADRQLMAGFAFGAWVEDSRVLKMSLDAPDYEVLTLSLDIAGGIRQGILKLCFPAAPEDVVKMRPAEAGVADGEQVTIPTTAARPDFSETALNLNAELRISISELTMPLRELSALGKDSFLEIGLVDFDTVRIQTIEGKTIGRGVLGQTDGQRAVQVRNANPVQGAFSAKGTGGDDLMGDRALSDLGDWSEDADTSMDLPDLGSLSEDAGMSGTDELPDMPDLPSMDEGESMGGMPDLPDLPDMSDLPELSGSSDDFPDLDLPPLEVG